MVVANQPVDTTVEYSVNTFSFNSNALTLSI